MIVMSDFGNPDFWEKCYEFYKEETFDWLITFENLWPKIEEYLKAEHRILITGCGNAEFSEKLYDAGYQNIYNIDISKVVIAMMSKRNEMRSKMSWEVMDICDIKYPNDFFDIVIDKSTIDAVLCGDNSFLNAAKATNEISRVLKKEGKFFMVSYAKPYMRLIHLKRPHLDFSIELVSLIGDQSDQSKSENFLFVCSKGPDSEKNSKENFEKVIQDLASKEKSKGESE